LPLPLGAGVGVAVAWVEGAGLLLFPPLHAARTEASAMLAPHARTSRERTSAMAAV
jgi:hypothetical protein